MHSSQNLGDIDRAIAQIGIVAASFCLDMHCVFRRLGFCCQPQANDVRAAVSQPQPVAFAISQCVSFQSFELKDLFVINKGKVFVNEIYIRSLF